MRINWSQWHFDRYAPTADLLAVCDADVVLHTWVPPLLTHAGGELSSLVPVAL